MIFPSLDFMLLELWYWDCLVHNCLPLPGTCLAYSRSSLMFIKLRWFLSLGWFYAIFLYPKAKTENANTVSFVLYECVCVCVCVCVVFCSHLCFSVYILVPNSFFSPCSLTVTFPDSMNWQHPKILDFVREPQLEIFCPIISIHTWSPKLIPINVRG